MKAILRALAMGAATMAVGVPSEDRSIVVTGTRGSIRQPNFIEVDTDDRVIWTTGGDERVEHHGTTATYTHQLAALRAAAKSSVNA